MDRPERLREQADQLEALTRELFAATVNIGEHTRELARATAYWMISLRRLADSGPKAWASIESRFPPDSEDEPADGTGSPEGPGEFVGGP
jgi:hypothetical protein